MRAQEAGSDKKVLIGYQARMNEADSLKALDAATASWNHGRGVWAQACLPAVSRAFRTELRRAITGGVAPPARARLRFALRAAAA